MCGTLEELVDAFRVRIYALLVEGLILVAGVYPHHRRQKPEVDPKIAEDMRQVDGPYARTGHLLPQRLERTLGRRDAKSAQDHLGASEAAIPVE